MKAATPASLSSRNSNVTSHCAEIKLPYFNLRYCVFKTRAESYPVHYFFFAVLHTNNALGRRFVMVIVLALAFLLNFRIVFSSSLFLFCSPVAVKSSTNAGV